MVKYIKKIKYADCWIPESWIFEGGDEKTQVPIDLAVFLIKTENKLILVDAGCETLDNLPTANFDGILLALQKQKISPKDITDVIITHAHHDHIASVKYFDKATIYIQQEEYKKGKKYIPETFVVRTFEKEYMVDRNVRAVTIGGHSRGSCVVEVTQGKTYVLCGDECYTSYNLVNKVPTASSFCQEKSKEFIEHYGKGEYVCLLCHDVEEATKSGQSERGR